MNIYLFKMNQKQRKLEVKGHNVNPVIIEIEDQEKSKLIRSMIKKNNSQLHYAGGFKNGEQSSKQKYRPEEKLFNAEGIYQEVGVSKMQPKYRVDESSKQAYNEESYTIKDLESKINLLKKERADKNHSLLHPKDYYTIADEKSRFQEAVHVKSSLDVIDLDHIEAKLEAHRRSMKPIEKQYYEKKGKAIPNSRLGVLKFNIDVDKEYQELNLDSEKMYELSKKRENMGPDQIEFEELWEQRKRNDPKLAEYDAKYQQFLIQKQAKNIIGYTIKENISTWDNFTQPEHRKQKSKIKPVTHLHSQSKSTSKQKRTSPREEYGPDGLMSVKDLKDVIATKDDKFISNYIFAQIDEGKIGLISKQQLNDYILSQQHIINGYQIDTKWLFTDLDNFETKRKGMFTKAELAIFLATLQKIDHPSLTLTSPSPMPASKGPKNNEIGSTFNENRKVFQNIFNALDFNDDRIIKREEFIENIYIDSDCVKILDTEAIYIRPISKSITYRQIIGFVLDDWGKQRNQKIKKSKEYITFARFCEYFEVPQSLDLSRIDKKALKKRKKASTEWEHYDLPEEYLQLLKDIYNTLPRIYQDYIISADFVQTAMRDPQIMALSDQLCRIQSIETGLPLETLHTTLYRMQSECDEYSNWDSLKLYFSRRGRPLDWDYELIQKKKEIRKSLLKEKRSSISKDKLNSTKKYFEVNDKLRNHSKQKAAKGHDKYTIPQPFNIVDMKQKHSEGQIKRGELEFEEYKKQFKAKPVNQEILEPKPDLIAGKILSKQKSEGEKRFEYKYENYENDRIERALKRAQEQNEIEEQIKAIKEKTEVKALGIGIDLTKKYQDVIKEQKRKEKSKMKVTEPKVSENLYPKNIAEENAKKLEKIKNNIEKGDEVAKRKKQQQQEIKNRAKEKNEQAKRLGDEAKQRERQENEKRKKMGTEGFDFKPTVKPHDVSQSEKEAIEKARREREKKKKQEEEKVLRAQEQRRKKILAHEKKNPMLDIEGMEDEQILQKLDEVNFEDLLLDERSKKQYRKQFDNKNKTRGQLKEREGGLAGRQRAAMEAEQKRMEEEKRAYKENKQKQRVSKGSFSRVSESGEKSNRNELDFHKSKALRRYRALMEGKEPVSEWDKYSQQNVQI